MSTPHDNADTLMRLYELRRESKLREARTWFVRSFNPTSPEDVLAALRSENSAFVRMVTSYWDMAASFVVHGALDAEMFQATSGEMLAMYCKVEHMIDEVREVTGQPTFLKHVELVATDWPGAPERMAGTRRYFMELAASD